MCVWGGGGESQNLKKMNQRWKWKKPSCLFKFYWFCIRKDAIYFNITLEEAGKRSKLVNVVPDLAAKLCFSTLLQPFLSKGINPTPE